MERFTVTEEHLALLRRAYTSWDQCEYGAPQIDPKRPYGNSSVEQDIAEILGVEPGPDDWRPFTDDQVARFHRLHGETETVLQIALRTGRFEVGEYEAEPYGSDWRKVAIEGGGDADHG